MDTKLFTRARRRAFRRFLDTLEPRTLLNSSAHPLASGALVQNWESASLITAGTLWQNVPSIEGFGGSALSGSDPRTILGPDVGGAPQVNHDQTSPGTYQTGGPAEFALSSPIPATPPNTGLNTVALQGSSSADVPYLKLYLDATGVTGVQVRYDLIDIDSGAPSVSSTQPFALQYRVGNTGNFTNLPGGYVANAANQTSGAVGLTNSINVTLPADADNQPLVEVRILTIDATNTDQFVAIDNINVSSTVIPPNPGQFSLEQAAFQVAEDIGTATFTVRRLGGTAGAVSVDFATSNVSAIAPGDYTASSGTLNFADGVDSLTFTVPVINDVNDEPNEVFKITLSNPTGGAAIASPASADVTIVDDDVAGALAFSAANYAIIESGGTLSVTVERSGGSSGAVSVNWATVDGTAVSPDDFTAASGVLNFADGETSKSFTITINEDTLVEPNQDFTIVLSSPTNGATLGTLSTATATITDNDTPGPAGLILNEINLNPPGADLPYQFVELRGTPGLVLENVFLIEIEGDSVQNAGKINSIVPLGGATLGNNGLLLVRSSSGFAPESGDTGVFDTSLFNIGGVDFQPGSASFVLLYETGTFSLAVGNDLDPANSGTLTLPGTAIALDMVGVLDGTNTDKAYGAVLGPIGTNSSPDAPDALARFYTNTTPNSASAWFWGNLVGATSDSKTFTSVVTQRSTNFPVNGALTPGGYLTAVASVVLDFAGSSQSIVVTFNEDVGASLAASDFELTNLTAGGTPVTLTLLSVSPDGTVARLGFTGTGGLADSVLVDGDYQLRVKAGEVGDGNGVLGADHLASLFFKNADFNHDRSVNFDDLLILAQSYGTPSGATFGAGDVNYDGRVDFDDLLALAQRYGTTLVSAPVQRAAAKKRFGDTAFV